MDSNVQDGFPLQLPLTFRRNAVNKAKDVVEFFDEEHYYTINGARMKYSCTGLLHNFFHKFNATEAASNMISSPYFFKKQDKQPYWSIVRNNTKKEAVRLIIKMWNDDKNDAATKGTAMHQSIEDYYKEGKKVDTKEFGMFMNFHNHVTSKGYIPLRVEQIVWSTKYSLAGSVDMLYIHKSQLNKVVKEVYMCDWKRSKDVKTEAFHKKGADIADSMGLGPMSDKPDCTYEHYALQLNIYKYLLERTYNIKIVKMHIIVLHPNQDEYKKMRVDDNKEAVREILATVRQ